MLSCFGWWVLNKLLVERAVRASSPFEERHRGIPTAHEIPVVTVWTKVKHSLNAYLAFSSRGKSPRTPFPPPLVNKHNHEHRYQSQAAVIPSSNSPLPSNHRPSQRLLRSLMLMPVAIASVDAVSGGLTQPSPSSTRPSFPEPL